MQEQLRRDIVANNNINNTPNSRGDANKSPVNFENNHNGLNYWTYQDTDVNRV